MLSYGGYCDIAMSPGVARSFLFTGMKLVNEVYFDEFLIKRKVS
jgi:hypothetical protein